MWQIEYRKYKNFETTKTIKICNLEEHKTIKCNEVSWKRSWDRKRPLGKNKGNLNNLWTLVNLKICKNISHNNI